MSGSPSIGVPPNKQRANDLLASVPLCDGSLPATLLKRNLVAWIGSLVNPWVDLTEGLSEVSRLLPSAGSPTGSKVTRPPPIGLPGPTV
jgi:hypothetical protein